MIDLQTPPAARLYTPPADTGLVVLYADADLLVLDKPSGLLSVPGRGPAHADCLLSRTQRDYPDALVVHRLDMDTSGILLLARNLSAQRALSQSFAQRETAKTYIAVVGGHLQGAGEVDLPLLTDWPNRPRQKVDREQGKPALTYYQSLQYDAASNSTRVELRPVTGRSHQLRVHLQALGHPILGDDLYAPPQVQRQSSRLLLHAALLSVRHPVSGAMLHWSCPAPF